MLKHYVQYLFPGILFDEYIEEEIADRNAALVSVPNSAFGYRFFDKTEIVFCGEKLVGESKNFSPTTYFGTVYTLEEIKRQFPEYQTLIDNMEANDWNQVVRTRTSTWKPLKEGDVVINP